MQRSKVHNFCPGTLDCYFRINDLAKKGRVVYFDGGMFLDRGLRNMCLVWEDFYPDSILGFQKRGPVYSLFDLHLENGSKFSEIVHNLKTVFDPKAYKNSKKRYQRLVYPFKQLQKNKIIIREIKIEDFPKIEKLHIKWRQRKLDDPKTFRHIFPGSRYIYCVKKYIEQFSPKRKGFGIFDKDRKTPKPCYKGFLAEKDGNILAARVVDIQRRNAFELATFGNTWESPSQFMNYFDISTLKILHKQYKITFFNRGASTSKNMKCFKTHLPYEEIHLWRYPKIKIKEEK